MSLLHRNEFLLVFVLLANSLAINLHDEEIQSYIDSIVADFDKNPREGKFVNIIPPPACLTGHRKIDFLLPKILLWSPCEQFELKINCPIHKKITLKPWQWAKDVNNKCKGKNARMVFDLFGNIVLVQRIYLCVRGRECHKLMSATPDVMCSYPLAVQNHFPVVLFERSACTENLINLMEEELTQGVNFLKLSEGIASMNFKEFCRRRELYMLAAKDKATQDRCVPLKWSEFYSSSLFSFPSREQLINIFLSSLKTSEHLYENYANDLSATAISCDHTFKISRNIGVVVEENQKFVPQYKQAFIVLNEKGQVLGWRLTKTQEFSEVQDLLQSIKTRCDRKQSYINTICLDNCCQLRQKYVTIFPGADVKLDLFHACQRITKTLTKDTASIATPFTKEFTQVFRGKDDQDITRSKHTPDIEELEKNLNSFIQRWTDVPNSPLNYEATSKEIENLKKHIKKGCLSYIPPGYGTERNEQLHSLLNRSMITGATKISVELAIALLTMLFYYHSSKITSSKHVCNARVTPVVPISGRGNADLLSDDTVQPLPHFKTTKKSDDNIDKNSIGNNETIKDGAHLDQQIIIADSIYDLCVYSVFASIVTVASNLQETIENVATKCMNRAFNAYNLMHLSKFSDLLTFQFIPDIEDPTINAQTQDLEIHLNGFGLVLDPVEKDGDCAFRSIIRQLRKIDNAQNRRLHDYLLSVRLLSGDEDKDTQTLRQLFVAELLRNGDQYAGFIAESERPLHERANEFRLQGVFDRDLGDLMMKVCCDIVRVPIMVITSNRAIPVVPFVPGDPICNKPIYVAFHYYGAGHYDATNLSVSGDKSSERVVGAGKSRICYCGRHAKGRSQHFCTSDNSGSVRCPCLGAELKCSKQCRCINCLNQVSTEVRDIQGCRCGENKKLVENKSSCCDVPGQRRTKCPCYVSGIACSTKCRCKGCTNSFGTRAEKEHKRKRETKQTSSPKSLKRQRGVNYLKEANGELSLGSWSTAETCILEAVKSFLHSTCILPSEKNIHILYNGVVQSNAAKSLNINANCKTINQVKGKLSYDKKEYDLISKLAYGVNVLEKNQ